MEIHSGLMEQSCPELYGVGSRTDLMGRAGDWQREGWASAPCAAVACKETRSGVFSV